MGMKLLAAGLLGAGVLLAVPANATTDLASYTETGFSFFWSGGDTTAAVLRASGNTNFTFDAGALSGDTFLAKMEVMGSADSAAMTAGGIDTQSGIDGSVEFVYEGPTQVVDGVSLQRNVTVLLEGTYTDAEITGAVGSSSGTFQDGPGVGGVNYTTVAGLSTAGLTDEGYDFTLDAMTVALGTLPGTKSLPSFKSDSDATSTAVTTVPEPGTWAMMILGLFTLGFVMRGSRKGFSRRGAMA